MILPIFDQLSNLVCNFSIIHILSYTRAFSQNIYENQHGQLKNVMYVVKMQVDRRKHANLKPI